MVIANVVWSGYNTFASLRLQNRLMQNSAVYNEIALSLPTNYASTNTNHPCNDDDHATTSNIDIDTTTTETSLGLRRHRTSILPPSQYYKTFYMSDKVAESGVLPFFVELGYQRVQYLEDAHIIWSGVSFPSRTTATDTYKNISRLSLFTKLERWQRLGYLPTYKMLNDKGLNIKYMKLFSQHTGQSIEYIPRTYQLNDIVERNEILHILQQEFDSDNSNRSPNPWILKHGTKTSGKGVTMMGPRSTELRKFYKQLSVYDNDIKNNSTSWGGTNLLDVVLAEKFQIDMTSSGYTIQQYICNLLTYEGRKFDLRIYWLVVSIDPLIVLFHYGQVRANPTVYNTSHFESDSLKHMTHAGHGSEVLSWKVLEDLITQHFETKKEELSSHNIDTSPFNHVVNQMKHILGHVVDSYKDVAFQSITSKQQLSSGNGYQLFGADFLVDKDLDVFFIEVQTGPLLGANYTKSPYFATLSKNVIQSTLNLIDEVQSKQSQDLPILPFTNLGTFDPIPIHSNGITYKYNNYNGHKKNKRPCQFSDHEY